MKRTSETILIALVSRKVSYTLIEFPRLRVRSPVFKRRLVGTFVNNEHGSITDSSCAPNMYNVKVFLAVVLRVVMQSSPILWIA